MSYGTLRDVFHQAGMRLTKPRMKIAEIVLHSKSALRPDQVHALARRDLPGIGLVTVYRTLDVLQKTGLTERVHSAEHCRAVTQAEPGHNHVLVCSVCGKIVRFEGEDLSTLFSKISAETGYSIVDHLLQLHGLCPACRKGKIGDHETHQ